MPRRLSKEREMKFPRLDGTNYCVTSEETDLYNCIAWAAGIENEWWWPDNFFQAKWPINRRAAQMDCFVEAFQSLGYERCEGADLEFGVEKVAIFVDLDNTPTHMARQLEDGQWTSKCGDWEDITHELTALAGDGSSYGEVSVIMQRQRR